MSMFQLLCCYDGNKKYSTFYISPSLSLFVSLSTVIRFSHALLDGTVEASFPLQLNPLRSRPAKARQGKTTSGIGICSLLKNNDNESHSQDKAKKNSRRITVLHPVFILSCIKTSLSLKSLII